MIWVAESRGGELSIQECTIVEKQLECLRYIVRMCEVRVRGASETLTEGVNHGAQINPLEIYFIKILEIGV